MADIVPVCPRCAGSEACATCDGRGGTREDANPACPSANATWTPCADCEGTGTCPACREPFNAADTDLGI